MCNIESAVTTFSVCCQASCPDVAFSSSSSSDSDICLPQASTNPPKCTDILETLKDVDCVSYKSPLTDSKPLWEVNSICANMTASPFRSLSSTNNTSNTCLSDRPCASSSLVSGFQQCNLQCQDCLKTTMNVTVYQNPLFHSMGSGAVPVDYFWGRLPGLQFNAYKVPQLAVSENWKVVIKKTDGVGSSSGIAGVGGTKVWVDQVRNSVGFVQHCYVDRRDVNGTVEFETLVCMI
jgi:hypothetical protein